MKSSENLLVESHFFDGAELIAQLLLKATKQDLDGMNYSAASCGVTKKIDENLSQGRHPGDVFIGGPVRTSPGFPLEACGNNGLR
jgi:hypothetical protein